MRMNVIKVQDLIKKFGATPAINGISFNVEQGKVFGFLGPNGAGKTTTIRCLMDFIRPTSGSIELFGKDSQKFSVPLKQKIGYLSGQVKLYDKWTGQDHFNFVRRLNKTADQAAELSKRLDFNPNVKTRTLSSGNRQKLGIILAFMCRPELLIFDEPTNALDPLLQYEVYKLIQEAGEVGTTIFMSSHNLAEVDKVCDQVGIIKQGKMVAIEKIQTLKQLRLHKVDLTLKEAVPALEFETPNMHVVRQIDKRYQLTIKGEPDVLIKKLHKYSILDLEITHASLEEIFLEYYQQ